MIGSSRSSDFEITRAVRTSNWTEWSTIEVVIVSITKFSIVIGSPRAYRICHVISARSRGCPSVINTSITRALMALIISQCLAQFSTILKRATNIFAQKNFTKDIFNSYNSGSNRARNFKSASRFALVRFGNYSACDYSLNCTPLYYKS